MKFIIDIEDVKLFDSALSHAIRAYADIVGAEYVGCQIPSVFERYFEKNNIELYERYEHLNKRLKVLKDFEKQIKEKV